MEILVFKTNLESFKQSRRLYPLLKAIKGILKWNVDFEDNDKILRLETANLSPRLVEIALRDAGFYCRELE
jgi:hypothetical protein